MKIITTTIATLFASVSLNAAEPKMPNIGIGTNIDQEAVFYVMDENNQYREVDTAGVKDIVVSAMMKLAKELCVAPVQPAFVLVNAGVAKVTWDMDKVCSRLGLSKEPVKSSDFPRIQ